MVEQPLPIIQSCPHAGLDAPPEVAGRLAVSATDIYNDADLWVGLHYDFSHPDVGGSGSLAFVSTPIARMLVDVNRKPEEMGHWDGPVKEKSSYKRPIYRTPLEPWLRQALFDRYWQPYHMALAAACTAHAGEALLLLDCHTMAQHSPDGYSRAGAARPLICLANLGDHTGEAGQEPVSCPPALLRAAGEMAAEIFAGLELLEPRAGEPPPPVVALNSPFPGGYILRRYGGRFGAPAGAAGPPGLPAIMVEVNRGLIVGDQTADTPPAPPNEERVAELRRRLHRWAAAVANLAPIFLDI